LMYPEIFRIGPIAVRSYGAMLALGFLTSAFVLRSEMKRRSLKPELVDPIVTAAVLGGILGAKVYYLLQYWKNFLGDPLGMAFSGAGLVWYGGLLGGTSAVLWLLVRRKEKLAPIADSVGLVLPLGYAFGRLGCLLNGDDYGVPTELPWGMVFPKGSPPSSERVHPTQIYEMTASLAIFAVLWKLRRKPLPDGVLFWMYLILAGAERFAVEFLRTNRRVILDLTVAQMISAVLVLSGAISIVILLWRS